MAQDTFVADLAELQLLSRSAEGLAFWRLRLRLVLTLLKQGLARRWFRAGLVLVLSLALWAGLFWLFVDIFRFLRSAIVLPDMYEQTIRAMFGMFFVSLMVMLMFSSGILLYGLLFRSREVAFLLTLPVRVERIFLHKFEEAVLFSSWGFLLLATPMLLAYGIVAAAPWYFYVLLIPFAVAFVCIPSAAGAIICLWVVHRLPNRRLLIAVAAVVLVLAGGGGFLWSLLAAPTGSLLTPGWFQQVLGRLSFTEQRLLPSWWLSSGLLEAARRQPFETVMFLLLMVSNALFVGQLAMWLAGRVFRSAYSGMANAARRGQAGKHAWLDQGLVRLTWFLPPQVRLLIVKDTRLFHRDPVQWSQFLIFFGLLALYFLNIRRFSYDVYYAGWVNMISFLNLSVVGLLLSTFNTRFVFPLISLEGRRLWILGLLPLPRETILWSKFWFASIGAALPSSLLILTSDIMLDVTPLILGSHLVTCVLLSLGLAGLAVGLGASMPELRDQSPSRIAASEGGTLNLVLGTLYILIVVLLTALPCHFYYAVMSTNRGGPFDPDVEWYFYFWLALGTLASVLLAAVTVGIPMWLGIRVFRQLEV